MNELKRYSCTGCKFTAGDKQVSDLHLKRKVKCSDNPSIIYKPTINCIYCNLVIKTSTRKIDHINIHLESCNVYQKELKEKKEKEDEIDRRHALIIQKIINTGNNNTNNNNNNNTNLHLTINNIYNPNISHLGENIEEILKIPYTKMYNLLYFNKDMPENHGILYGPKEIKMGIIKVICDEPNTYEPMCIPVFQVKNEVAFETLQNRLLGELPKDRSDALDKYLTEQRSKMTSEDIENEKKEILKISARGSEMVGDTIRSNSIVY